MNDARDAAEQDALTKALTARRFETGPSLDEHMSQFGFDPAAERLTMLPNPNGSWSPADWTAPQWLYDMAKAFALPGHVARGGNWSPQDAAEAALSLTGGGGAGVGGCVL